ncbi:hypothetical protein [Halioxenophilus sp. WMMB6]|uniref:hypothetical protein n=1 Tax=Halioxenophilus sp. WMMB6 TaxID=3073815 RepID=UPI00295E95D1|nr:hypothetical protein [Halioxenophilus sp. WMMB6]
MTVNKLKPGMPLIRQLLRFSTTATLLCGLTPLAMAGEYEQAKRIYDRLVGVPATEAILNDMAADIAGGDAQAAAYTAMEDPRFYSVTIKNWVTPWTNEEQDVFQPLNDYTATVIGYVRDNKDFRGLLYDNVLYVGASSLGLTPYSNSDNSHYQEMETQNVDLSNPALLVERVQSEVNGLPAGATSGVITSRAAAKAYFYAGTNRAMFRFTLINHLCNDLEQVHDTTRPPDRIRQDVSRSPGGDSRVFLNSCIGCHSGMDPMVQSYAYYTWVYDEDADPEGIDGHMGYNDVGQLDPETGSRVQEKYRINANTFPMGYVTPNDHWDNYWREGINQLLGWDSTLPGSGDGAKSMNMELAHSEAFASCQVKKVFKAVCLRSPVDAADRSQLDQMIDSFQASNYNIKQVFAESADYCKGE